MVTREDIWEMCRGMSLGQAQNAVPPRLRDLGLPEGDIERIVEDLPSYYASPHTPEHDA